LTAAFEISCVIPAYESVPLLARALMSILTQEDIVPHTVVVDDSRGPEVKAFVDGLSQIYPHLEYYEGARTGNPADNWNAGLDRALGPFCVLVHHDEFLLDKGYLRRAVDALRESGAEAFAGGHSLAGAPGRSRFSRALGLARLLRFAPWTLYVMNWIGPTAAVVFEATRAPRFDRRLCWLVDVDFYFRLLRQGGRLIRREEPCVVSLWHAEQISRKVDGRLLQLRELAWLRGESPDRMAPWQFGLAIACAALRVPPWLWRDRDWAPA
jgi:glycosyltransferase involved in cell wall biosynthesis